MGGEFGQESEWSHDRSLDWHFLESDAHRGVQTLVRTLNLLYRQEPALWDRDFDPSGFRWIDANDADQSVYSFLRFNGDGSRVLACVANLTPMVREDYRIGLPCGGRWREILNTDAADFGGSAVVNPDVVAEDHPWHGQSHSTTLRLPPLGVVWLVPE
jgi:1,4-alpha-glucan branching enzyme